jgi:hypothetical protein
MAKNTCDICGRDDFKTPASLKQHQTVAHGPGKKPGRKPSADRVDAAMAVLFPEGVPVDRVESAVTWKREMRKLLG